MNIIAVANQKGGVGKTTTVGHPVHNCAMKKQKVLVVALDTQGHVLRYRPRGYPAGRSSLAQEKSSPVQEKSSPAQENFEDSPASRQHQPIQINIAIQGD